MKLKFAASVTLFVFWLLMSGIFTPFLVASGLGCSLVVVWLSHRLRAASGGFEPVRLKSLEFFFYGFWLFREIIIAAWDVTKRIIHPKLPISPAMVEFVPSQSTEVGLVIHANSITLTPGTISVEVEPGRFLVHALTEEGGASLAGSEMDRRCALLEV